MDSPILTILLDKLCQRENVSIHHTNKQTRHITYIVYSIYVDSCLQQQTGLSVKAMLGHVMESIHILLQTEENKGLSSGSEDSKIF